MPDYNMLFQGPNAGQSFQQGFQQAQDNRQRQQMMQMQMQRQQQQDQRQSQQDHMQAIEAHRENIVKGAQIIRQLNPKDDASWQQAKALAAQAGIDVSEVPDHYDPQYVQGISAIADAFSPQKAEGKDIAVPQGGAVLHRNADGTTQWTVMPNGEAPPTLTDDDIRRMEGGQAGQSSPASFSGPSYPR